VLNSVQSRITARSKLFKEQVQVDPSPDRICGKELEAAITSRPNSLTPRLGIVLKIQITLHGAETNNERAK
jgi:hypothetical protein